MSTLLFTGWTGYIGTHTLVEFLTAWYEVVVLDNLSNSEVGVLDTVEKITGKKPVFYEWDIWDKDLLGSIFQTHSIDTVVHFAGLKAVGESCEKVSLYHDNNIVWSIVLFEAMELHGVRNIVFSSSATVYSNKNPLPLSEGSTLETNNPYGTTKLVIEYLLKDYARHAWWHVVNLRYFNPIGAHASWLIGENPRWIPNNLLPYVMQVAVWQRDAVQIFGNDYDTPDGTGVRDYIHVVDLAKWHLKAYEYINSHTQSGYFESCNLGTGKGTTVLEIVAIVSELIGHDLPYEIRPRRSGDSALVYCDPDRARELLGWTAELTVADAIRDSLLYAESSSEY